MELYDLEIKNGKPVISWGSSVLALLDPRKAKKKISHQSSGQSYAAPKGNMKKITEPAYKKQGSRYVTEQTVPSTAKKAARVSKTALKKVSHPTKTEEHHSNVTERRVTRSTNQSVKYNTFSSPSESTKEEQNQIIDAAPMARDDLFENEDDSSEEDQDEFGVVEMTEDMDRLCYANYYQAIMNKYPNAKLDVLERKAKEKWKQLDNQVKLQFQGPLEDDEDDEDGAL